MIVTFSKLFTKHTALLLAIAAVLIVAPACKKNEPDQLNPPSPAPQATLQIAEQLLPDLLDSPEIARITGRGILLARIRCDRPPLCHHDEYGVPTGFEVDLLQKIARTLDVKLNVVEDPGATADIEAPAILPAPSTDDPAHTTPYLFRAPAQWYAFRIPSADPSLQTAVNRLLHHFYETGTYQQLYKNRFAPAPERAEQE